MFVGNCYTKNATAATNVDSDSQELSIATTIILGCKHQRWSLRTARRVAIRSH